MYKCDLCGAQISIRDLDQGAILSIADQPDTDTLCVTCNSEEKKDDELQKSA